MLKRCRQFGWKNWWCLFGWVALGGVFVHRNIIINIKFVVQPRSMLGGGHDILELSNYNYIPNILSLLKTFCLSRKNFLPKRHLSLIFFFFTPLTIRLFEICKQLVSFYLYFSYKNIFFLFCSDKFFWWQRWSARRIGWKNWC